ncbi:MAG: tripartite tricarboxylate transporter permease, partial [Opitutales bacterium]|nr:tripartite tricarboxylate transporter permease [Opitutales bacterium]
AMLICGFVMSRVSIHVLRIPVAILMPVVALFAVIGSYSFDFTLFNVYLMVGFGIVAYFLREMGYPVAPLVIGIILGPMAEVNLRRALIDYGDTPLTFFTRPIALILMVLIIGSIVLQFKNAKKSSSS